MHPFGQFLSALVLTYFASRLARRLPFAQGAVSRLAAAHGLSLAMVAIAVLCVRLSQGGFRPVVLAYLAIAQFFWFVLDGLRRDLGRGRKD